MRRKSGRRHHVCREAHRRSTRVMREEKLAVVGWFNAPLTIAVTLEPTSSGLTVSAASKASRTAARHHRLLVPARAPLADRSAKFCWACQYDVRQLSYRMRVWAGASAASGPTETPWGLCSACGVLGAVWPLSQMPFTYHGTWQMQG